MVAAARSEPLPRLGPAPAPQQEWTPDRRRGALMAAAQTGDRAAYTELLRECATITRAIARRQGVAPDRVDDVVQDTLLTVHRARQTYDPRRSFTAWLHAIAVRRAIDVLRGVGRHGKREVHAPAAYEAYEDAAASPHRDLERVRAREQLAPAIAALPTLQREAVQRLVLEERSLAETAALTGRKVGALKVNLHRAMKSLRAILTRKE